MTRLAPLVALLRPGLLLSLLAPIRRELRRPGTPFQRKLGVDMEAVKPL